MIRRFREWMSGSAIRPIIGWTLVTLLVLGSAMAFQTVRSDRARQAEWDAFDRFMVTSAQVETHRRQAVQFALTTLIDQGAVETADGELLSIRQSPVPTDGRFDVTVHIASSDEIHYDSRVDGQAEHPPMTEFEFHSNLVWRGPEGNLPLSLFASQFFRLLINVDWPDRSLFDG